MTATKPPTSAQAIKGSVKEAIGKLTGDGRVEAEGRSEAEGTSATRSADETETPKAGGAAKSAKLVRPAKP